MKISRQVEPLVREAFAAVITKERDRLQQALDAFPDDEAMTDGVRLASAIALFVVQDKYGRNPAEEQLREAADDVSTVDDWTDISSDEVVTFFTAAINRERADAVLPPERVVLLAYVAGGYLLSFHHEDGEEWWDYLDRAEAAVEATPMQ